MQPLRLVVCVKQVPATRVVPLDPRTHAMVRDGVPMVINPDDELAMEAALRLREAAGASVTAVSMGPLQAEAVLAHCLRMGADQGVLLTDPAMAGSDTLATSRILAAAIKRLGFDVVLCGRRATDAETGQVGPGIAELLGVPVITHVIRLEAQDSDLKIHRETDDAVQILTCSPPMVVSVSRQPDLPRPPSGSLRSERLYRWSLKELDIAAEQVGLIGSPTRVIKAAPGLAQDLAQADYPADASVAERLEFVLSGGIRPKADRVLVRGHAGDTARHVVELLEREGLL